MKIEDSYPCPLIDCHIHYPHPSMMTSLTEIADTLRLNRFNIVCTPHEQRLSLVPDALHLKAHHPERVFVFGGLNLAAYFMAPDAVGKMFSDDIDLLFSAGCDGIKIIEGKPQLRKMLPIPAFDSVSFAPFWEKAAQSQTPILMHINDPEEFWDKDKAPDWAFERGWFYGDGTFINNEKQYSEIFNVLKQNPTLKIIFAHFLFMSAQLPRLADLLDTYPNMYIDLTPGIEMYHNFSVKVEEARDFFIKYQDRIMFGTDIGAKALLVNPDEGMDQNESHQRVFLIRNFLETDGAFYLDPEGGFLFGDASIPFQGINLPRPVLDKIYFMNFEKAVAVKPRPVNPAVIVDMCHHIEKAIQTQGSIKPGVPGDTSVVQSVRSYFEPLIR